MCVQWPEAALRGVAAIQRGRARAAYPAAAAAAAAAAFARPQLASALHGYTPVLNTLPVDGGVYYDPFLTAHTADPNYRLQVNNEHYDKTVMLSFGRTSAFLYVNLRKSSIIYLFISYGLVKITAAKDDSYKRYIKQT